MDVAGSTWIDRFADIDDEKAFEKEMKVWKKRRREFLANVSKPLEIHCFTCQYNADGGMKPLLKLVKHPACDAGTALRLFWINDPVYYSQYASISDGEYESEKEGMRFLRAIKQRFKRNDFKSSQIYFDPAPWLAADDVNLDELVLPPSMISPTGNSSAPRKKK